MTSTLSRDQAGQQNRPPGIDLGRPRRRNVPLALVAVACMAVSVVAFVGLQLASSDRSAVLVVARPVAAGAVISDDDLAVAQIGSDPALRPIPVSSRASVVGRTAAIDLAAGTLLVDEAMGQARNLAVDEAIVGVEVAAASAPTGTLAVGDRVQLVETQSTAANGSTIASRTVLAEGRVTAVTEALSPASGAIQMSVAVSSTAAPSVATASADGRIAVVVLP